MAAVPNLVLGASGEWEVVLGDRVDRRAIDRPWHLGGVFGCRRRHASASAALQEELVIKIARLDEADRIYYSIREWHDSCRQLQVWSMRKPADGVNVATLHASGEFEHAQTHQRYGYAVMTRVGEVTLEEFFHAHLIDTQTEADQWILYLLYLVSFIHAHGSDRTVSTDQTHVSLLVQPHIYAQHPVGTWTDPKRRLYAQLPSVSLVHGRIQAYDETKDGWSVTMPYNQACIYDLFRCFFGWATGHRLFHSTTKDIREPPTQAGLHAFASLHFRTWERNQVHLALALAWQHPLGDEEEEEEEEEEAEQHGIQLSTALAVLSLHATRLRDWRDSVYLRARYLLDWISVLPPDTMNLQVRVGIETPWRVFVDSSQYGAFGRVFACCPEAAAAAQCGSESECSFVLKVSPRPPLLGSIEEDATQIAIASVYERLEEVRCQFGDQATDIGHRLACVVPRFPMPQWYRGDITFLLMTRIPKHETWMAFLARHQSSDAAVRRLILGLHHVFWFLDAAGVIHKDMHQDNLLVLEHDDNQHVRVSVIDFDRHERIPGFEEAGYECGKTYAASILEWVEELHEQADPDANQLARWIIEAFIHHGYIKDALSQYWKHSNGSLTSFDPWMRTLQENLLSILQETPRRRQVTLARVPVHAQKPPEPFVDVYAPRQVDVLHTEPFGSRRLGCEDLVYDRKTRTEYEVRYSASHLQYGFADGSYRLERIPLSREEIRLSSTWFKFYSSPETPTHQNYGIAPVSPAFSPVSPAFAPVSPTSDRGDEPEAIDMSGPVIPPQVLLVEAPLHRKRKRSKNT
jgi:hypothetical protein